MYILYIIYILYIFVYIYIYRERDRERERKRESRNHKVIQQHAIARWSGSQVGEEIFAKLL